MTIFSIGIGGGKKKPKTYANAPKKDKQESDILGIASPRLVVNATGTMTQTIFDTTSKADSANILLNNATAGNISISKVTIYGKPVRQVIGGKGLVGKSFSDNESIRKNGLRKAEIENEFINSKSQLQKVESKLWQWFKDPRKIYTVGLPGRHFDLTVGDWYNLVVTDVMGTENFNIIGLLKDLIIEESGSEGLGMTQCSFVEVKQNWDADLIKLPIYNGSGQIQRNSYSNEIRIAPFSSGEQADFYTDGTADNVEIQYANDYLSSVYGGGTITLLRGSYSLDEAISLSQGIILQGQGNQTSLVRNNGVGANLYVIGCVNHTTSSVIRDLSITQNYNNVNAYSIHIYESIGTKVERVTIRGGITASQFIRVACNVVNMTDIIINSCDVYQVAFIASLNATVTGIVTNCRIDIFIGLGIVGAVKVTINSNIIQRTITLQDCFDCVISNNTFDGAAGVAVNPIVLTDCLRCQVVDNRSYITSLAYGIVLNSCNDCLVKGNEIKNVPTTGIYLTSGTLGYRNIITSNNIDGDGITDYGIYVDNNAYTSITNNIIYDMDTDGIYIDGDSSESVIAGNTISYCDDYGIYNDGANNVQVTANNCQYNGYNCYIVDGADYNCITGNIFDNASTARGLQVESDHCTVTGNNCNGNTTTGIYIMPNANRTVVTGNRATGNGTNFTNSGTNTTNSGNDFV